MNKKIFENARFCPKGDTEANWNKALGFIPLKKEIIEYLPDENHSTVRFKVGDGVTPVQDLPFAGSDDAEIKAYIDSKIEEISSQSQANYEQNDPEAKDYIKNRPFYEIYDALLPAKIYTFDGNLEGKEAISADGIYYVKVSDDTLNEAQLFGATLVYSSNSTGEKEFIIDEEWFDRIAENIIIYTRNDKSTAAILSIKNIDAMNSALEETLFSSTGTYFYYTTAGFISQLILNETAISIFPSKTYTFDGNLEGKEYVDLGGGYYIVKISADIPPIESLIGGQTTILSGSELITETISNVYGEDFGYFLDVGDVTIIIDAQAASEYFGCLVHGPGIYFGHAPGADVGNYTNISLTTITYTGAGSFIKQIDEKFIPKSIARISDVDDSMQELATNVQNVMQELDSNKLDKTGGTITGALTIKGDLTVQGTNTAITTQTLNVKDNIIVANSNGVKLIENAGFAVKTGVGSSNAAYGVMYDVEGDGVKIGLGKVDSNEVFTYDDGEAQFLATRADSIANGSIPQWDNKTKKFIDSGMLTLKVTTNDILRLFDEEVVL